MSVENKIAIIGNESVGSSIANELIKTSKMNDIVVVDTNDNSMDSEKIKKQEPKLNTLLMASMMLGGIPFPEINFTKRDYKCDNPDYKTTTRKFKNGRCCCRECYDIILKKKE